MQYRHIFLFLTLLFSASSQAHVQWFVAPEDMKDVYFEFDLFYAAVFAFVAIFTTLAISLTRLKTKPNFIKILMGAEVNLSHRVYVMVFVFIQMIFFSIQVIKGGFIAPNIVLTPEFILLGLISQLLIILTASISISLSGVMVIITSLLMVLLTPWEIWINYVFEFVAIGIFMLFTGSYVSTIDHQFINKFTTKNADELWASALTILRIGIGAQLAILALTEKLIYPGLAVVFIEMFPFYNIFPQIGLTAGTDMHFVFFIGICELSLGLLLMSGMANRLTMIMLTFAFVTTAIIHGIHEVEGHLPIFAAAFVLLLAQRNEQAKLRTKPVNTNFVYS
ncbi:hypothetical protein C9J22_20395 [Photobacterium phosphoreum]|uniref:hypothetical protein n=1 Tax=Photobacterium phosphoreum TaxID=659 RepID=UPI000D15B902|nr:hypothetical protein [Photobacterium phosphoreum]PSU66989.1 hypothetical protein C9J22_20395 [Photobacterium phosphoreum]